MKSPAFQFYVRDWLLSRSVQKMSGDEVKAYIYLLCESWLEDPRATLPNNDEDLAVMAKLSTKDWERVKGRVMANFNLRDNRYVNDKLAGVSEKQQKFREWGLRGGNPNLTTSEPKRVNPKVNGMVNPNLKGVPNLASSSSSSSDASPSRVLVRPSAREVTEYAKSLGFVLDGEYFIDKYEANGWMVGRSKMKDWKATVRTWKKNGFQANGAHSKPAPVLRPSYDDLKAKGVA